MSPDASVVVVTYQCRDSARACLRSLRSSAGGVRLEVIVLDNASTDGTVEMVKSEFPEVRLLASSENLGFAAGVNRAVAEATGEYVLLLNPDTVVEPLTVGNLVRFAREHASYGLYGGRAFNPDGSVQPGSCWGKPTVWSLFCFTTMLSTVFKRSLLFDPESLGRWQRDSVREVDIVTGCLLLARRDLWAALGGFDERFFMYGEDVDLALRTAGLGLRNVITPDAVVTHENGASSRTRSDKLALLLRGKATLIRKHWPPGSRELGLALLWSGVGVRALLAPVAGRGGGPGSDAAGWRSVWRERDSWLPGYGPGERTAGS